MFNKQHIYNFNKNSFCLIRKLSEVFRHIIPELISIKLSHVTYISISFSWEFSHVRMWINSSVSHAVYIQEFLSSESFHPC